MIDYNLKVGDTTPPLRVSLTQRDITSPDPRARVPINLSNATGVRLFLKNRMETLSFAGDCTITDAPNGSVQWPIDPLFTGGADYFFAEFRITWTGGATQRVPNQGYIQIEVEKNLA